MYLSTIIGILLIAMPLMGGFVWICVEDGIGVALTVFGVLTGIVIWALLSTFFLANKFGCL